MEKVLKAYLDKLMDEISKKKAEVRLSRDFEGILDKVRDDLSAIGKNLLSMFFMELKGYIERNKPEFIENNKEKWQDMLDRAEALTEYGLYVAPVDILKEQTKITPTYLGAGVLVATGLISKLLTKKVRVLPAFALALASGVVYSNFYDDKEKKQKDVLEEYINDAYDWIKTALENMYKIFKDAL
ncbi:hypothetical protein [Hippea alviniae]|uniref:hypothetical protein n=1 Tax=Hippea alviniae TaxID=1279027 RepID=UPI0003B51046|nr:hypothetical protein [Hippea alviniae]